MKKLYRRSWIEEVERFQSMSENERQDWCSNCGCAGGCNLCTDISKIKEEDIVDDDALYEYLHRDIAQG